MKIKMKNKNKLIVGSILTLVLGLGMVSSVSAFRGDKDQRTPNQERQVKIEEMTNIMESGDYAAWKALQEDHFKQMGIRLNKKMRNSELINESNFAQFAEAWKLVKEGNFDEAKVIRESLGLNVGDGDGHRVSGRGHGMRHLNK